MQYNNKVVNYFSTLILLFGCRRC